MIYIGTSGWMYSDWHKLYPKNLAKENYLFYFGKNFQTVEINSSFYHLPKKETFEKWARETPHTFVFSVKLSRYITHIKRLKNVEALLALFLENAEGLGKKIGPVLAQFPPNFKKDLERVENFLEIASVLNPNVQWAFEFRHPSWFENIKELLDIFSEYNAALVFADSKQYPYPKDEPVTADFIYLRFHGPEELFASRYSCKKLESWAEKIQKWEKEGKNIYAYFNNDIKGYAIDDASKLKKLVNALHK